MAEVNLIFEADLSKLRHILPSKGVYIIYDKNVEMYLPQIGHYPSFGIESSEENKTFATVIEICRWLLANGADRSSMLVAFGGGITSDLTGFTASIFERGIRFANVPTTLLAQVDAAIGGKNGVNLDSLKNMLGTFRQPEFTYISPLTLSTLPHREFLSGIAEMLKTFIISSECNYCKAVDLISNGAGPNDLSEFIRMAAEVKADIVKKDEFDNGCRKTLNLGHTFGHAIEWYEHSHSIDNPLTHGEAVAAGIIAAARISEDKGIAGCGLEQRISEDFKKCGLPDRMPYPESLLKDAIAVDKKNEGGRTHMILIERIGKVIID